MTDSVVGYNPEIAKKAETSMLSYRDSGHTLLLKLSDGLVEKLEKCWFAPESKVIVQSFIDIIADLAHNHYVKFSDLLLKIQKACTSWAQTVGENYQISVPAGSPFRAFYTDASAWMKDDNNGFRGIISQNIPEILTFISGERIRYQEMTNNVASVLRSCDFFLGANQMNNFLNELNTNLKNVQQKLDEVVEKLNKGIEETKEKYQQTAQANAQRFASGN